MTQTLLHSTSKVSLSCLSGPTLLPQLCLLKGTLLILQCSHPAQTESVHPWAPNQRVPPYTIAPNVYYNYFVYIKILLPWLSVPQQ